ncbi:hypothetical protein BCAR13_360011 [Paraburkholderia caribensis]|nr:hypothetical protein BCAR13_360011 [Paraburkholderia caribensis]
MFTFSPLVSAPNDGVVRSMREVTKGLTAEVLPHALKCNGLFREERRGEECAESAQRMRARKPMAQQGAPPDNGDARHATEATDRSSLRNLDLDLEHFEVVVSFEIDADIVVRNLHVLRDHGDELTLQRGQIIGGRFAAYALVRDDQLQALLRYRRGLLLLAQQKRKNRHHVRPPYLVPKRRCNRPGFW